MHNEFVKYIRRGRAQANVSGVLYDSEGRNGKVPCKMFIDSVWIDERLKLLYY